MAFFLLLKAYSQQSQKKLAADVMIIIKYRLTFEQYKNRNRNKWLPETLKQEFYP